MKFRFLIRTSSEVTAHPPPPEIPGICYFLAGRFITKVRQIEREIASDGSEIDESDRREK